jgi:hypothetical protein
MRAAGIGAAEAFFRLPFFDLCREHRKLLIQIGAAAMGAFSFCGTVGLFEKFTYPAAFAALIFKNRHYYRSPRILTAKDRHSIQSLIL